MKRKISEQLKDCAQWLEPHIRRVLNVDCCADADDNVERAAYRVIDARHELLPAAKMLDEVGL